MLIRAEHIRLHYGSRPLFKQLNLHIPAHEIVALVGPSGAGKSSLLACLAGLQPLNEGKIYFDQQLLQRPRSDIAMMFQDPTLLPWLTVADNVGFVFKLKNQEKPPRAQRQQAIQHALELVGLQAAQHLYPHQLSGGMAQRVALARCLVRQPRLLLLDEPFSALDQATRQEMQQLLLTIHAQTSTTIVVVTHDLQEAITLAQRVIMILPKATGPLPSWTISTSTKHNPTLRQQLQSHLHHHLRLAHKEAA